MKKTMIMKSGGISTHYICPSCIPDYSGGTKKCSEVIPNFYSEEHAKDNGWMPTRDIKFCPPSEPFVWVCPECWNS